MAQAPLLDDRVNPDPEAAAVKDAQVPVVYHVPAPMIHPFIAPPIMALRYPLPEKIPVPVGTAADDVFVGEVVGEVVAPLLGRYFTPEAAQVDFVPSVRDF